MRPTYQPASLRNRHPHAGPRYRAGDPSPQERRRASPI